MSDDPTRGGSNEQGAPDGIVDGHSGGHFDGHSEANSDGRVDGGVDGDHLPSPDQLIGTFLREASLWPVLLVVIGSGGAFTAALIVLAFLDRNPFAAAALFLILGMTADIVYRARSRASYRNGALLIGLVWLVGFVFTGLAVWSGIAFSG